MTNRTGRKAITLLAGAALLIAACDSGESSTEGIASLAPADEKQAGDAAAAETVADPTAAEEVDPEQAALQFSACMREEGLDFPDLAVDADGRLDLRSNVEGLNPQNQEFREAMTACREHLDGAGFGGGGRAALAENVEVQDAFVAFSQCVRDAGYDVGDLTLGPPGGAPPREGDANEGQGDRQRGEGQRQGGFGDRSDRIANQLGLDPDDPDVVTALDGCMPILDQALANAGVNR